MSDLNLEELKARCDASMGTAVEFYEVRELVAEVERLREEATEAHKERLDKAVTSRTVAALDDALQAAGAENRRLRKIEDAAKRLRDLEKSYVHAHTVARVGDEIKIVAATLDAALATDTRRSREHPSETGEPREG